MEIIWLIIGAVLVIGLAIVYKFYNVEIYLTLKNARMRWKKLLVSSLGVAIAIAMIVTSNVLADSVYYSLSAEYLKSAGKVDIVIESVDGGIFDEALINDMLDDLFLTSKTDAMVPWIFFSRVPTLNNESTILASDSSLLALPINHDKDIGDLVENNSNTVNNELLDGLEVNEILITEKLANEINASAGDEVILWLTSKQVGMNIQLMFSIKAVIKSEGIGAYSGGKLLITSLNNFWNATGISGITGLAISLIGGVADSLDEEEEVVNYLEEEYISKNDELKVNRVKLLAYKSSESARESMMSMFTIFSLAAILASLFLLVTLFYLLADERKKEYSILKASGVTRSGIFVMLLGENVLLTLIAALVGTIFAIGYSWVVINTLLTINAGDDFYFTNNVPYGKGYHLVVNLDTILMSNFIGGMITIATSLIAAWMISSMKVTEALKSETFVKPGKKTKKTKKHIS